ncbi:MAG: hypothetical protein EOM67_01615 [Spirochaetia bacterium]|nr:hypothetical protein [Spirochaetia bacterium]
MKFLKNSIVALAAILTTSAFASDYIETRHDFDKDFRVFGAEGTTYIFGTKGATYVFAGSEYLKIADGCDLEKSDTDTLSKFKKHTSPEEWRSLMRTAFTDEERARWSSGPMGNKLMQDFH